MDNAWKRWCICAVVWPICCLVFAGIILCLPGRNMEERICDAAFCIFPLIFFAIGMPIRRRILRERACATARTTAVVTSPGRRKRTGKNDTFFPEFEFQAGGRTYRITSVNGSGLHRLTVGRKVDLYYAPDNPTVFYVLDTQRLDRRVSALLCGIGIVFPLAGLFAPKLREVFSFLYN